MHGSVVRSWLLELAVRAFKSQGQDLQHLKGWVADSGEGRWTVQEAIDHDVPAPVITLSPADPVPLPPGRLVRGQGARRAAQRVRRPRGQDRLARTSGDLAMTTKTKAKVAAPPAPAAPRDRAGEEGRAAHDARPPARDGDEAPGVRVEAAREPAPRGPAPRARPGPGDLRAVRRDRRPRASQGRPGAVPAVADAPAAPRVHDGRRRPPPVHRRPRSATSSRARSTSTAASSPWTRRRGTTSPSGSSTTAATSTTRRPYSALAERLDQLDEEHGDPRQPPLLPRDPAVGVPRDRPAPGQGGPRPRAPRRRLAAGRHREAVRPRPRLARSGSTARWARSSASGRSTASTTTWARRPSGTCWCSGSATGSSSRSGTAATSTTCRSRWRSRSGSRTAARSTRRPAPRRDFLQNHLLQLLSLVAMEPPATFDADALRDEKVKVIRAIPELTPRAGPDATSSAASTARAGCRREAGPRLSRRARGRPPVARPRRSSRPGSPIDDWRWSGVPFYLRMGKRLPKRATEIAIQFKEVPHRLFKDSATDPEANLLAMRIQPDEGIMLRFGAKVPGLGIDVRNVTMDFTYGSAFQVDSPDAYETLILDVLLGDASLFTRADEVEEAWAIVDPIIAAWAEMPPPDVPQLRGRLVGPRGGRRPARPRGPALAPDLTHDRWTRAARLPRRTCSSPRRAARRSRGRRPAEAARTRRPRVRRDHRGRDAARRRRADRAGGPAEARRADDALALARALDRRDRDGARPDLGAAQPPDRPRRARRRAGTSPRGRR